MNQLENVLKKLKSKKSQDSSGFVNELFMSRHIGDDLKESLLMLINKIKQELSEPEFVSESNITTIWKGKGSRAS